MLQQKNICRCCLFEGCYKDISTEYFWSGKKEVYADMLLETFNITISHQEGCGPSSGSRLICDSCISRIRDAAAFKQQVLRAEGSIVRHLTQLQTCDKVYETLKDLKEEKLHYESLDEDDLDIGPAFNDSYNNDDRCSDGLNVNDGHHVSDGLNVSDLELKDEIDDDAMDNYDKEEGRKNKNCAEKPDEVHQTSKGTKLDSNKVKEEDLKKTDSNNSTSSIDSAASVSTDIDDTSISSDTTHTSDPYSPLSTENQENVPPKRFFFILASPPVPETHTCSSNANHENAPSGEQIEIISVPSPTLDINDSTTNFDKTSNSSQISRFSELSDGALHEIKTSNKFDVDGIEKTLSILPTSLDVNNDAIMSKADDENNCLDEPSKVTSSSFNGIYNTQENNSDVRQMKTEEDFKDEDTNEENLEAHKVTTCDEGKSEDTLKSKQLTFHQPLLIIITSNNFDVNGIEKTVSRPPTATDVNNDAIMSEAPSCSSGTNARSSDKSSNHQFHDVEKPDVESESEGSKDRDYVPSSPASSPDDKNDLVIENECLDGLSKVTSSSFNDNHNTQENNGDVRPMKMKEDFEDEENANEENLEADKVTKQDEGKSGDPLKSKRIRERDSCYYCKSFVLNFSRHLVRNHLAEREVQLALSHPKKSLKRKTAFTELRKKGNYNSNAQSAFKPMKKCRSSDKSDYLPCSKCLGFYSKKQLWRHVKTCNNTGPTKNAQVAAQNFLVRHVKTDKHLVEKVFPRMRPDKVSLIAKKDKLICMFGAQYQRTHREKHFANIVSRKMRELARLLMEVAKLKPDIQSVEQMLKPQYYDLLVLATKMVARYNNDTRQFAAPTYVINIATSLKQCCRIALMQNSKMEATTHTASIQADLKTLSQLITENWKFDVSSDAADDLNVKKLNKPTIVPLATENDINKSCAKKKRTLVPWTMEQKDVVIEFFKQNIKNKKPPKRGECDELKKKYPTLLHNKDWHKIKVFIQNKYSKT